MAGWALVLLVSIWGVKFYRRGGLALLWGSINGHYRVA